MAQYFWKYKDTTGIDYDISVYRGDTSGHIILYCGYEIIKIDFGVHSDRSYSFMLGEELFELKAEFNQKIPAFILTNMHNHTSLKMLHAAGPSEKNVLKAALFVLLFIILTVIILVLLR